MGTSYKPSKTDYATRHSRHEPFYLVSNAIYGASQMQQDRLGFNRPHPYLPPLSYSQPHQLLQPTPSTVLPQFSQLPPVSYNQPCLSQHPLPSSNQPQFSQLQAHTGYNSAGNIFIHSVNIFLDECLWCTLALPFIVYLSFLLVPNSYKLYFIFKPFPFPNC